MGGVGTNIFASTGVSATASSGGDAGALSTATYGPEASGSSGPLSPKRGQGAGFWLAVGGVAILICIRQSLPR